MQQNKLWMGLVATAILGTSFGSATAAPSSTPKPSPSPAAKPTPAPAAAPAPAPAPTTTGGTVCRRVYPAAIVVQKNGLLLRSGPSLSSPVAGLGYGVREQFQTDLKIEKDAGNLLWLHVTGPRAGWIWAGSNGKILNIANCP